MCTAERVKVCFRESYIPQTTMQILFIQNCRPDFHFLLKTKTTLVVPTCTSRAITTIIMNNFLTVLYCILFYRFLMTCYKVHCSSKIIFLLANTITSSEYNKLLLTLSGNQCQTERFEVYMQWAVHKHYSRCLKDHHKKIQKLESVSYSSCTFMISCNCAIVLKP